MSIKRVKIKIEGQVQGVGFRFKAFLMAKKLGLSGFAKNEIDNSVIIEIQGDSQKVQDMIKWAKKGPDSAQVSDFDIKEMEILENERRFETR